jgi:hypothetical protein
MNVPVGNDCNLSISDVVNCRLDQWKGPAFCAGWAGIVQAGLFFVSLRRNDQYLVLLSHDFRRFARRWDLLFC